MKGATPLYKENNTAIKELLYRTREGSVIIMHMLTCGVGILVNHIKCEITLHAFHEAYCQKDHVS